MSRFLQVLKSVNFKNTGTPQAYCDVLVVGGGSIGSSIAYWLKKKARNGLNVVVVEKDMQYKEASSVLSVGGLRQQFSLSENIEMCVFGAEFFRNAREYIGQNDLKFTPNGYLMLATEDQAETLVRNSILQNKLGARNELLTAEKLKERFPWININGIELGCHGLENEGWFDPWTLLKAFKDRSREYGASFEEGEVIDFKLREQSNLGISNSLSKAIVRGKNGETKEINFAICVVAAGSNSGEVARLANIGTGPGLLSVPLPIEPRKRYVFVISCKGERTPNLGTPLTVDPNGTYFRCDSMSGNYLCGRSPTKEAEPSVDSLDVDYEFFEKEIWPSLANRVKAFESIKVCGGWAGYYDYNRFDENGIIGRHPYYNNLYIAAGFSGHGIQQSPAVGRAISELIIDGQFRTIDLTRLGCDRIFVDKPMFESNVV